MFSPAFIFDSADLFAVHLRNSQNTRHNSPSTFPYKARNIRTLKLNLKPVHRYTRIHVSNDSNQPSSEESAAEQPNEESASAAEQPQASSGFITYQEDLSKSVAEQPQTSSGFTAPPTSSGFTTYQEDPSESAAEQPQTSSGFTALPTSSGFTTYQEDPSESAAEQLQTSSGFTTYQEDLSEKQLHTSSGFTTYHEDLSEKQRQTSSGFTSFQEDPLVDKLRTQLGVIHPLPSPPVNRNIVGFFIFFFLFGVVFDKLWTSGKRSDSARDAQPGTWPQVPTSFSSFLEKDLRRKESVEWVNMVLGKLWKVYRSGIENWIIGSLQPVIDNLKKPEYVQRVEIKQFSLGDEPLSVRNVERKTSRRDNDLQYQIGIRYTGGARMLLSLSLKFGIIPLAVPVRVRDFDIDGELWVKLRLVPAQPWVGAASWAFVSLPKIKFELSPFRLFNLMAIPVLSMFLTKLLTEDLPRQFVRPKKIVLDFQKGKAVGPISDDFKTDAVHEGNKDFVGELSVTLVDARKLAYVPFGKTDPYVVLRIGDQVIYSKKNSQTTVIGPPGQPIWNQDFNLLVANPRKQKLHIEVKDSFGFNGFTIGTAEIGLGSLQDTVPTDRIIALKGRWGPFLRRSSGEILLRLTYKAYVEEEEEDGVKIEYATTNISKDEMLNSELVIGASGESKGSYSDRESFMDVLAALIVSEEFQGIVSSETGSPKVAEEFKYPESAAPEDRDLNPEVLEPASISGGRSDSALVWLAVITSIAVLIAINVGGTSDFNP